MIKDFTKDDSCNVVLEKIVKTLEEAGYDAMEQLNGYVNTRDPQYITRHGNARTLIQLLNYNQVKAWVAEKNKEKSDTTIKF